MNVLIVDDEISAIQAVSNGIEWGKLGIEHVYTAANVQEAIRQFDGSPIDILLSDIEMPMGSGLELLQWTNKHYPNVKCVFMTCHAEFNLLQEAMRLGSVNYILKPLDFSKVEIVLQETMEKIRTERMLKENSNSWIQNKKTVVKQFWKDFFLGEISPNKDSLTNYFRQKRLNVNLESLYLPILIVTKKWTENVSKEDQKLLQYGLRNITEELLKISDAVREVISFSDTSILVMLQIDGRPEGDILYRQIETCSRQVIDAARIYIKEIVCCYIGVKDTIYEMPSIIESLQEMDFNNVIYEPDVYFLHQGQNNKERYAYSDNPIGQWREWMKQGRYAQVLKEIEDRLTPQGQMFNINRDFLRKFSSDYYYLIFGFAADRNIFVNELFADDQSNLLLEKASESLDGLLQWVNHAMDRMRNFDQANANRDNPVERTKQYINMHLSEELSMEQIANNVHLNPDYLTRIFKKQVGVSISKHMINKKMEAAKDLMMQTDKSIGEIALLVGYYNYSSFNRIFTKETGMSPQEFKKQQQKQFDR